MHSGIKIRFSPSLIITFIYSADKKRAENEELRDLFSAQKLWPAKTFRSLGSFIK